MSRPPTSSRATFPSIPGAITDPTTGTVFPKQPDPGEPVRSGVAQPGRLPAASHRHRRSSIIRNRHSRTSPPSSFASITRSPTKIASPAEFTSTMSICCRSTVPRTCSAIRSGITFPAENFMVQETHIFRPNLLNQASFIYSSVPVGKVATADSPNMATFGVKGIWQPATPFIQSVGVTSYFTHLGRRGRTVQRQQLQRAGRCHLDPWRSRYRDGRQLAAQPGRSGRRLPGTRLIHLHLRPGGQCAGGLHDRQTAHLQPGRGRVQE